MRPVRHLAALALLLAAAAGCSLGGEAGDGPVIVLAASDLQVALTEIAERYRADGGGAVELVFGSTGNLATQIEHGAPADLFFSANERFLDRLTERGHVQADTRTVYGIGRLALVVAPGRPLPTTLDALADDPDLTVAIANPEHAPYGVAAREALQAVGVWEPLRPRLVFGENVAQALQFVRTGNADMGIVALALVVAPNRTDHLLIDASLHSPLRQVAGVLRESQRPAEARAFLGYVVGQTGTGVLRSFGFLPDSAW